jgi:hypothetical protein
MVYNTIQHPHPYPLTATHCQYIMYSTFSLGRGGGREVIEKVEGQQFTSIVPSSMGAMSECISIL